MTSFWWNSRFRHCILIVFMMLIGVLTCILLGFVLPISLSLLERTDWGVAIVSHHPDYYPFDAINMIFFYGTVTLIAVTASLFISALIAMIALSVFIVVCIFFESCGGRRESDPIGRMGEE